MLEPRMPLVRTNSKPIGHITACLKSVCCYRKQHTTTTKGPSVIHSIQHFRPLLNEQNHAHSRSTQKEKLREKIKKDPSTNQAFTPGTSQASWCKLFKSANSVGLRMVRNKLRIKFWPSHSPSFNLTKTQKNNTCRCRPKKKGYTSKNLQ
jgi:hypothetical protein